MRGASDVGLVFKIEFCAAVRSALKNLRLDSAAFRERHFTLSNDERC